MSRRRRHVLPQAKPALDRFKYEVAEDLGLRNDIRNQGWENMTTRETGKIGGNMVRRLIGRAERGMAGEEYGTEWAGYSPASWPGSPEYTARRAAPDRRNQVRRRRNEL